MAKLKKQAKTDYIISQEEFDAEIEEIVDSIEAIINQNIAPLMSSFYFEEKRLPKEELAKVMQEGRNLLRQAIKEFKKTL